MLQMRHALYEAGAYRIWNVHENNRDGTSGLLQRCNCNTADTHNDVGLERDQFRRVASKVVEIAPNVSNFNLEIAADRPTQLLKGLRKDFAFAFLPLGRQPQGFAARQ